MKLQDGRCNSTALRQAARHVAAAYDRALAPSGLKTSQFSLLYKLAQRGALRMTELSDLLVMDRTTLTRNLRPLESQRLVVIFHKRDKRERFVEVTREGLAKLEGALPLWERAQAAFEAGYGIEQSERLRKLLRAVVATKT